jgi:hypothetical protein
VDQHGHLRAAQLGHESVHASRVVPVTVAQHDDVDLARGDVEASHVLDEPVRSQARVEENPDSPAGLLDRHETREAVFRA